MLTNVKEHAGTVHKYQKILHDSSLTYLCQIPYGCSNLEEAYEEIKKSCVSSLMPKITSSRVDLEGTCTR